MKMPGHLALFAPIFAAGVLSACSSGGLNFFDPITPTQIPAAKQTPTTTQTQTPTDTPTQTPVPTTTSTPTGTPTPIAPISYLEKSTLFTVYGRAFDVAPILGMLGAFSNTDGMAKGIQKYVNDVDRLNGARVVLPGIHLIYGLAIPCSPRDNCLLYLDAVGVDIVKEYIEPAAKRGWQVILDSQNGRATPMDQVRRMLTRGYLKYDNVHIALDPEFASVPGHDVPGIPIGSMDAGEINLIQQLLDDYVRDNHLAHRKILMIHQFGDPMVNDSVPSMIRNKKTLKIFPNVDLVIVADGFGSPDSKVSKYNKMTDGDEYPTIKHRAIKLFYPNPYEKAGHFDRPILDYEVLFGQKDTPGGLRMRYEPEVIIIA